MGSIQIITIFFSQTFIHCQCITYLMDNRYIQKTVTCNEKWIFAILISMNSRLISTTVIKLSLIEFKVKLCVWWNSQERLITIFKDTAQLRSILTILKYLTSDIGQMEATNSNTVSFSTISSPHSCFSVFTSLPVCYKKI